jgi:hypothetical protein
MQLFGEHAGGAGARACLAIAHSGPVVGADLYKFRDLRLNRLPLNIRVAETGIQKHRRISEPGTVDMHLVAPTSTRRPRTGFAARSRMRQRFWYRRPPRGAAKIRMAKPKVMRRSQFRNVRDTGASQPAIASAIRSKTPAYHQNQHGGEQ